MNIVQTATSRTSTLVPGGDLGPGTRALITATCDSATSGFTDPVTPGNSLLAFVTGSIPMAGSQITLGPSPNGIDYIAGGSLGSTIPGGTIALYFGSNRFSSTDTVNRGVLLQQVDDGATASSCLYAETLAGPTAGISATFSYTATGFGSYSAIALVTGSPSIRGSNSVAAPAVSSLAISFPAGSVAGDLAVLFAGAYFAIPVPSGWTGYDVSNAAWWNGAIFVKTLTSADIAAGSVTVSFLGDIHGFYDATLAIATLFGSGIAIGETDVIQRGFPPLTITVTAGRLIYYVQATYEDSAGNETAAGPEYAVTVPAFYLLRVSPPANPNFTSGNVPGAVGWNLYVSLTTGAETRQNTSLLDFITTWTEPTGGLITGTAAPTIAIEDTVGNVYESSFWTDGLFFGTTQGAEAMGVFLCPISAAGTPTITFRCVAVDANPVFGVTVDIDIVLFEVSGFSDATVQDVDSFKQSSGTGSPTVTTTRSDGTMVTSYGPRTNDAGLVIDFFSGGKDNVFALLTGDYMPEPVAAPVTPVGTYSVIARMPSTDGFPLYVWLLSPRRSHPQFFVVL